ncbi:MAG: glycosyltransferase family 4 protein [Nitrospira sp.]|nr:MAG: glycosyltransferase family 4 protein [Nitrospira sp.]
MSSIHTVRWVHEMAHHGYNIHLITMHSPTPHNLLDKQITLHRLPFAAPHGYVLNTLSLRAILRRIKPAFLHTHYAGGYGTLSRRTCFHPTLLSFWGSDVLLVPSHSKWKNWMIRANLLAADYLASTSVAMKVQTERLVKPRRPIALTPFGVDGTTYYPRPDRESSTVCTIGTVKSLESVYGIEYLLRAFAIVVKRNPNRPLRLLIVGGGSLRTELEQLAVELRVAHLTDFTGKVPACAVPDYLRRLSVYVCLSLSESFGVSVLEASACGLPVVVSDVGGLPEVVKDGVTGFIIPKQNAEAAAGAIERLITDPQLAADMGCAGRAFVMEHYEQKYTGDRMARLYCDILREERVGSA